jgi:hypothetical protein
VKDLYRHVGLYDQVDDPNTLATNIAHCRDRAAAVAAEHVLLNPRRKAVYDRNHRLLMSIGQLRDLLALQSDAWEALGNQDFDITSPPLVPVPLESSDLDDVRVPTTTSQLPRSVHFDHGDYLQEFFPAALRMMLVVAALIVIGLGVHRLVAIYASFQDEPQPVATANEIRPPTFEKIIPSEPTVEELEESISEEARPSTSQTLEVIPPATTKESGPGSAASEPSKGTDRLAYPLPASGVMRRYDRSKPRVPIKFVARRGSYHFFVKLIDARTDEDAISIFVRGGQTTEVKIPSGVYKLHYSMGETWYGPEQQFGEDANYGYGAKELDCRVSGNEIPVYTVDL